MTTPTAEQRQFEIRNMIAKRGWTEEIERIASMRVAIAMEAAGLKPPPPYEPSLQADFESGDPVRLARVQAVADKIIAEIREDDDAPFYAGGMSQRQERLADRSSDQ